MEHIQRKKIHFMLVVRNKIFMTIFVILMCSCELQKESKTIKIGDMSIILNEQDSTVTFVKEGAKHSQKVKLTEQGIEEVSYNFNYKGFNKQGVSYKNIWYSFDQYGNFYHNVSNYIEAYPYAKDSMTYLNVFYDIPKEGEEAYVLYNKDCQNCFFNEKEHSFDTIPFINGLSTAMIPLEKKIEGTHVVEFIVVHSFLENGMKSTNKLYGKKQFTVIR